MREERIPRLRLRKFNIPMPGAFFSQRFAGFFCAYDLNPNVQATAGKLIN